LVLSTATYEGEKHCSVVHAPSSSTIETDAPLDNNGKGQRFSPTDLVAAALGTCILTVMSILAERDGVDMKGATATVEKTMTASPRRIASLVVTITMPPGIDPSFRIKLENAADTCPVRKSLHPDIAAPIVFIWS
jgi:putative redox protein